MSDRRVGNSVVLLSGLSLRPGHPKPVDSAGQPTALDATSLTQP